MIFFTKRIYSLFFLLFFILNPINAFGSGFGLRPANPLPENPRTESIFIHLIEPGDESEDAVKIINNNNEDRRLILYSRNSTKSSGGGFACMQLSEKSTGVGEWIEFNLEKVPEEISEQIKTGSISGTIEISIPANSEVIIPFNIKVPRSASVGEHNGCILVQEIKDRSESSGVSLSMRSGSRVVVTVPGEILKNLEINDFKIERNKKDIHLKPSAKNTGNVSIDANIEVVVRNFLGIRHKTFGGEFPILRDEVYDFNFRLKKPLLGGIYFARTTIKYDAGESSTLGLYSGDKLTKISSRNIWFLSLPTIPGFFVWLIIIIFIIFCVAIWRLNKKKKKWIKRWIDYTVKPNEDVESISKSFRVHWEILVEVNKITPPYKLKEGQIIKVPPRKK